MSGEIAPVRPIGSYRLDVNETTGIYVSTIFRESSAMAHCSPYYETMAFWIDGRETRGVRRSILWQSAAGSQRGADRMHDIAVRWFSRGGAA